MGVRTCGMARRRASPFPRPPSASTVAPLVGRHVARCRRSSAPRRRSSCWRSGGAPVTTSPMLGASCLAGNHRRDVGRHVMRDAPCPGAPAITASVKQVTFTARCSRGGAPRAATAARPPGRRGGPPGRCRGCSGTPRRRSSTAGTARPRSRAARRRCPRPSRSAPAACRCLASRPMGREYVMQGYTTPHGIDEAARPAARGTASASGRSAGTCRGGRRYRVSTSCCAERGTPLRSRYACNSRAAARRGRARRPDSRVVAVVVPETCATLRWKSSIVRPGHSRAHASNVSSKRPTL